MAHSTQLGCERIWSRLQVRAELGLARDTRWIATTHVVPHGTSANSSRVVASSPLRHSIQTLMNELRWNVPTAKFGLLVIQPDTGSYPVLTVAGPYDCIAVACDGSRILDWMCAADAWLTCDASPISQAVREIAPAIQLPCFSIPTSSNSPKEVREECNLTLIAQKIADSLSLGNASFPYASVAIDRSPRSANDSISTIDSIRNRLQKAIEEEFGTDGSQPEGHQYWRAA